MGSQAQLVTTFLKGLSLPSARPGCPCIWVNTPGNGRGRPAPPGSLPPSRNLPWLLHLRREEAGAPEILLPGTRPQFGSVNGSKVSAAWTLVLSRLNAGFGARAGLALGLMKPLLQTEDPDRRFLACLHLALLGPQHHPQVNQVQSPQPPLKARSRGHVTRALQGAGSRERAAMLPARFFRHLGAGTGADATEQTAGLPPAPAPPPRGRRGTSVRGEDLGRL